MLGDGFAEQSGLVLFKTETCYVAQAGLELSILLPLPPKCWDERHHHCPATRVFFFKLSKSLPLPPHVMRSKASTTTPD